MQIVVLGGEREVWRETEGEGGEEGGSCSSWSWELLIPPAPSRSASAEQAPSAGHLPIPTLGLLGIPGQASKPWPLTASAKYTKVFGLISRCSPVGYLIYSVPVNIHFTPKQGQVHHFCNHHLFMSGGLQEGEINGFP